MKDKKKSPNDDSPLPMLILLIIIGMGAILLISLLIFSE